MISPCARILLLHVLRAFAEWLVAFYLFLAPNCAYALNMTLSPLRYAEVMEFYYLDPKPELIMPLLRSFTEAGWLGHAEKRLSVAAFLAELALQRKLNLAELAREAAGFGRDARLTLAWAFHLARADSSPAVLADLLPGMDARFIEQIRSSPAGVAKWQPRSEPSVLGMYWSAFMACGRIAYIDAIIDCALEIRDFEPSRRAAASLYDYVPRHPVVERRIRQRLESASGNDRERLKTMLGN